MGELLPQWKSYRNGMLYYDSIEELPIWNWFKIQENDDVSYLLKAQSKLNDDQKIELGQVFERIYQEFLKLFGISDEFYQIISLRREIAIMKLDMYLNNDASMETFIEIKELELAKLLKSNEGSTTHELKARIEKFMGFRLDEKMVSVKEFYSYIELIKKEFKNGK